MSAHKCALLLTGVIDSMNTKSRKVTVLLEDSQFDRFESYCEKNGHKKSTLICKLITDLLDASEKKSNSNAYQTVKSSS